MTSKRLFRYILYEYEYSVTKQQRGNDTFSSLFLCLSIKHFMVTLSAIYLIRTFKCTNCSTRKTHWMNVRFGVADKSKRWIEARYNTAAKKVQKAREKKMWKILKWIFLFLQRHESNTHDRTQLIYHWIHTEILCDCGLFSLSHILHNVVSVLSCQKQKLWKLNERSRGISTVTLVVHRIYMWKHECYTRYRNRRRKTKTNRKNVWMRYGRYVCAYRVWQWYVCLQCDCWCATWDVRVERAILCVVCVMTFCHSYAVSCYQWNVVRIFATVIFSSFVPICVSVVSCKAVWIDCLFRIVSRSTGLVCVCLLYEFNLRVLKCLKLKF